MSKKKLLGSMARVKAALYAMDAAPVVSDGDCVNPFIDGIGQMMRATASQITNLCGAYMSYSLSSSSSAMKIEPYLVTIADGGSYVEVVHNSAYGATHRGFAMMNGMSHLYLLFNESRLPQLSLFNICLKIPMYDHPPFLRGLYTCFDYNFNPIARRILMVKLSDDMQRDEFMSIKGGIKQQDELTEQESVYYDYTCGAGDALRMGDVPAPTMSEQDLMAEKSILERRKPL